MIKNQRIFNFRTKIGQNRIFSMISESPILSEKLKNSIFWNFLELHIYKFFQFQAQKFKYDFK